MSFRATSRNLPIGTPGAGQGAGGKTKDYRVIVEGSTTELPELVPAVQVRLEPLCPNTLEAVISLLDVIVHIYEEVLVWTRVLEPTLQFVMLMVGPVPPPLLLQKIPAGVVVLLGPRIVPLTVQLVKVFSPVPTLPTRPPV